MQLKLSKQSELDPLACETIRLRLAETGSLERHQECRSVRLLRRPCAPLGSRCHMGFANGLALVLRACGPVLVGQAPKSWHPLPDVFHVEHVSDGARARSGGATAVRMILGSTRLGVQPQSGTTVPLNALARRWQAAGAGRQTALERLSCLIHTPGTMQTRHRDAYEARARIERPTFASAQVSRAKLS